jgi:hypothetical protein
MPQNRKRKNFIVVRIKIDIIKRSGILERTQRGINGACIEWVDKTSKR